MSTAKPTTSDLAAQLGITDTQRVVVERDAGARIVGDIEQAVNAAEAIVEALAEPLDFPPLARATVPGDQMAIALGEGIPQVDQVVAGALRAADRAGVAQEAVAVVVSDADTAAWLRGRLGQLLDTPPRVELHDPTDEKQLCYLGTSRSGTTLLANRVLYDADVVLPIGCARLPSVLGAGGVHDCLFPQFFDEAALARFRAPKGLTESMLREECRRETQEAGWLLGAPLMVQIVPGLRGGVARVVAGTPDGVAKESESTCRGLWQLRASDSASLVIVTLGEDPATQTWDSVARAVAAAEELSVDGGAIAICTNLNRAPGESLTRLIEADDLATLEFELQREYAPDSWSAWRLARVLQQGPVYLLSGMSDEAVEDLGLAPVQDLRELARLASHHDSVLLLEDAQHAAVSLESVTT